MEIYSVAITAEKQESPNNVQIWSCATAFQVTPPDTGLPDSIVEEAAYKVFSPRDGFTKHKWVVTLINKEWYNG